MTALVAKGDMYRSWTITSWTIYSLCHGSLTLWQPQLLRATCILNYDFLNCSLCHRPLALWQPWLLRATCILNYNFLNCSLCHRPLALWQPRLLRVKCILIYNYSWTIPLSQTLGITTALVAKGNMYPELWLLELFPLSQTLGIMTASVAKGEMYLDL